MADEIETINEQINTINRGKGLPNNPELFLKKFTYNGKPLTWSDVAKYGPGGTYHQEKQEV